jgi:uncharacterized protein YkwD
MARRFCSKCGAALEFSVQKFCTSCGATLPDTVPAAGPGSQTPVTTLGTVIPVWIFVIAGILVLGVAAVLLLPHFTQVTGSPMAGPAAGVGDSISLPSPPPVTPLTGITPVPTTGTAITAVATKTATSATTLTPTTTTAPATQVPTTTRTPTPTPATTVPTAEPTAEPTSVITLSITQVPPQPPSGSLTSSTPGAPYIDPAALESRVHALINNQRQQNGLSTLSYDPFLADIARGHSWDMVSRNFFEHMNPDGLLARNRGDAAGYPCIRVVKGGSYNGLSENLYQGNRYSQYYANDEGVIASYNWSSTDEIAERAVTGWMNSPGHRQNILTPRYEIEGIGVAFSADNKIYITENFC